uniref:Uncharacterized protein n=1 Tax=Anopheles farauti TaxID=69004 RepID=A0A182Q4Q4_9DIPT
MRSITFAPSSGAASAEVVLTGGVVTFKLAVLMTAPSSAMRSLTVGLLRFFRLFVFLPSFWRCFSIMVRKSDSLAAIWWRLCVFTSFSESLFSVDATLIRSRMLLFERLSLFLLLRSVDRLWTLLFRLLPEVAVPAPVPVPPKPPPVAAPAALFISRRSMLLRLKRRGGEDGTRKSSSVLVTTVGTIGTCNCALEVAGTQMMLPMMQMLMVVVMVGMQSGLIFSAFRCSAVVYQPRKMGVKEIRAGSTQTFASMKNTVRCVIYSGYSSGRTMAKYLRKTTVEQNLIHSSVFGAQ